MTLEEEAMRWLYAASLHASLSAVDVALGTLLALFLVAAVRLIRVLARQRRESGSATLIRSERRPDGGRPSGGPIRPSPMASARVLGGERRVAGRP